MIDFLGVLAPFIFLFVKCLKIVEICRLLITQLVAELKGVAGLINV